MADPVTRQGPPAEPPAEHSVGEAAVPGPAPEPERARTAPSRHEARAAAIQRRFGLAYLVLAVVVGAAVGLVIVFLGRPSGGNESSGHPAWLTEHGTTAATQQIARHIGRNYRLATGGQLVAVAAGRPQVQDVRISRIAVRPGNPDDRLEDIQLFQTDKTILYILCGLGQQCSIPEGKATPARTMLLQREGLELALYTLKYVSDVDSVLTFIPPPRGESPKVTLFFRRSDLKPQLGQPLRTTLPPRNLLVPGALSASEQAVVRRLTLSNPDTDRVSGLYQYQFQQSPDGTAILVLAPISA